MLWQSQIPEIKNKGKSEFPNPIQLKETLLTLLQTENRDDVNQATAIWLRNRNNYNFSNNDNLTVAAIGHDSVLLEKYFELVNGVNFGSRDYQDIQLAKQINSDFKSPWTMAFYGASLNIAGTAQLVADTGSNQLDFAATGIRSYSIKQFDRNTANTNGTIITHKLPAEDEDEDEHDESFEDQTETEKKAKEYGYYEKLQSPAKNIEEATVNKTAEAFAYDKDANKVYEVEMSNDKRTGIVIIIEKTNGDLYVYGTYFKEVISSDYFIEDYKGTSTYRNSKNYDIKDSNPHNWEQFQDQVKKYFGN